MYNLITVESHHATCSCCCLGFGYDDGEFDLGASSAGGTYFDGPWDSGGAGGAHGGTEYSGSDYGSDNYGARHVSVSAYDEKNVQIRTGIQQKLRSDRVDTNLSSCL